MQFSALLTALVAASLKAEFDQARSTKGFGKCNILVQPNIKAKLLADEDGMVRGFSKDLTSGTVIYSKMDFTQAGIAVEAFTEEKEAGKPFSTAINWRQLTNNFIAPPQEKENECDTCMFNSRLSHEGQSNESQAQESQGVKAKQSGEAISIIGGPGSTITDTEVDVADTTEEAATTATKVAVLEIYRIFRPSGSKSCASLLRRDPVPKARVSRLPEGLSLKEGCRSYDDEKAKATMIDVVKGFAYSELTARRGVKTQVVEMCLVNVCNLFKHEAKRVRVVRTQRREGREDKFRSVRVTGSFAYRYYKANTENKKLSGNFEEMNKACTNEVELLSFAKRQDAKFYKCGRMVKAVIKGLTYLMNDTHESSNGQLVFNEERIAPVDTKANDDFAEGVKATQAATDALIKTAGVITAPALPIANANFINFAVLALLF